MKKEPITSILTGNTFALSFSQYCDIREDARFKEKLDSLIYKKECWIPETENTYRTINHWMSLGLIDDTREDSSKWRKFNLMELVWIMIITKLREFGFSNEKILETKKALFWINWESKIMIEYYIAEVMFKNNEVSCVVFNNGYSALLDQSDLNLAKVQIDWYDYIIISVTSIIESITKKKIERKWPSIIPITDKEHQLYIKLVEEDWGEVKAKIKNGRIDKFWVNNNKKIEVTDIKNTNIINLIKSNPDSKIVISINSDSKPTQIMIEKSA